MTGTELLPCPFCGGPASHTGAAVRCNNFACNTTMTPRWTKDVVGSAKGDPDVRFALAKADCMRRWNSRAPDQTAVGMRALLRAGCDLLALEASALRASISVNGVMCPDPEDQATVESIREIEDWIASVKATLYPAAPEAEGGNNAE
ncbi:Lar family restriction alleviation protein [Paracoccus denitrificans]|uniref:Lar family restriction alleviation protein n=1 Tax=Paracoccus denitrificans TaxID=266 RepID=UPI001E5E6787|nr:Lar family restriction alleviation protein [Paracoccus denitrificans]UFS65306.1 Lar family restriction alleviation protein [Paracoccus denitrificans]